MSERALVRWGGLAAILAGLLFGAAAIGAVLDPAGGLAGPAVPTLYYAGLVLAAPAYVGIYAAEWPTAGRLGFAGLVLALLGSILYSAPAFALLAGTSGVETWHDIWLFATARVPILPVGASAFLVGTLLLGIATMRAPLTPRWAGLLLAIGGALWFVAFFGSVSQSPFVTFLLAPGSFLVGIGLVWIGAALLSGRRAEVSRPA